MANNISTPEDRLIADYAHCRSLAIKHYENFPVGRFGVPSQVRPHIHAIYAFARVADDFADEPEWDGQRLERLNEWEEKLEKCVSGTEEPVFMALGDTIRKMELPIQLFRDLLSAFKQDAVKQRYASWEEVLDYCTRSANPIGRLVLLTTGYRDKPLFDMSDALCTALQLTNFWQDLSVDHPRGRCYIPAQEASRLGVDVETLVRGNPSGDIKGLLKWLFWRTRDLYAASIPLPGRLHGLMRAEIGATWHGGSAILGRSERLGEKSLAERPHLSAVDKMSIVVKGLGEWLRP